MDNLLAILSGLHPDVDFETANDLIDGAASDALLAIPFLQ